MPFPPITREAERLAGIERVKRWLEERDRRLEAEREQAALEATPEWRAREAARRTQDAAEYLGGA